MAVDVNTANRSSTIAFTLPISCQICLGKVKSPVLCPNNHVFCSPCLATWLDRNQQCPACRTPIDQQNPYKEIRGGMSVCEEDGSATMRSAEMRRARFEMLFKDYESELSLTQAKMEALKVENTALQHQLEVTKSSQSHGLDAPVFKQPDLDALAAVTKKLEDVTELCSKLKQELSKYKKRNEDMKEENDMLLRENQRLRMEITSRSPHRYGRTTVAALQSQIDSYEKEVQQLNKALEKSDGYIEDLEQELSAFRGNQEPTKRSSDSKPSERVQQSSVVKKPTHKKQLFVGDNDESAALNKPGSSQEKPKADSVVSPQKAKNGILVSSDSKESVDSPTKGGKKVTFSLPGDSTPQGSQASSFDLEYPSPFSQSSDVSEGKPVKSTSDQPTVVLFRIPEQPALKKQNQVHQDISFVPHKETYSEKSTKHEPSKNESKPLNDSANIESELDELDISVTPELKDCMKLFNLAERNVHERESFGSAPVKSDCLPEQASPASKRLNFDSCEVSSSSDRKYPSVWPNPTCSASSSGTVSGQVDHQTQQERVKKASKSSSKPSNQSSSSTGGYFVHEPLLILGQHHMGSLINKTGSEASAPGLRTSNFKFRDSAMGPFKSQIGTPPVSVTSVSHSEPSNVLGSSFQTALPSSTSYFTPGSVTTTSLLPQTFSKSASSGAPLKQGPVDSTTHAASLSNSLLMNSKTTESLASSLNKLEQTLATHRSTRINIPKPSAYEQPVPGFSNPFPVMSMSSSLQYPSVGLTTIRPGIPATNQTLSSYVPLGPPLFSMGGVQQFPNPAPPSIKNISAASQYDTLSMSYPSAQQLSSSILSGQTTTSQSGPVDGYSGVPGRSASASSVPFSRTENSVKASSSSMVLERPNEYSYVTNSSLNSNDLSSLDSSFLPEPKKRLFETDTDDTDVSLSPMKSSKLR